MADRLRGCGFPAGEGAEEPALTFMERQAPVMWEMMYEGRVTDDPDWRRFWASGYRSRTG